MAAVDFIKVLSPGAENSVGLTALIAIADSQTGSFDDTIDIGGLGTKRDQAIALRTLHMIARNSARIDASGVTQGGFVTSESEGSLSRSYSISEKDKRQFPDLVMTTWGVELIAFIRANFFPAINRMM
jgi:hypothetical protein